MAKARAGDGMPRSNRRRRQHTLTIRLSDVERSEIGRRAGEVGLQVRDYARRMALHGGQIADPKDRDAHVASLAKLAFQTRRVGVSLNQLAHVANATGATPLTALLQPLLDDLAEVLAQVRSALATANEDVS